MAKIFTIIICSYNGENRINEVIESIIKQNQYLEMVDRLLLVDNNSSDNTKLLMKNYEELYSNIVYCFEKKQGLSNARLCGVNNTSSEWIIFLDDDNILEQNWLINAHNYIINYSRVGAFNGAVVPIINFEIEQQEKDILKVIYKGLGCTHLSRNEIDFNEKVHPCVTPFGAGLVIRTDSLRKLSNQGWLKSQGRIESKLVSGEDTEMCMFIKSEGYEFGYNPNMIINHVISKNRLQMDYSIKLNSSFIEYHYMMASFKKNYILRRIKYLLNSILNIIKAKLLIKFSKSNITKIDNIIKIETSKVMIKNILRDRIYRKNIVKR